MSFLLSTRVNGRPVELAIEAQETLAEVLRERLHLTGTKVSCDVQVCGACTYAGGTELLLAMKQAGLRYGHLVDLKTIPGLNRIEPENGSLRIGALATHLSLERSGLVQEHAPVLVDLERRAANARAASSR